MTALRPGARVRITRGLAAGVVGVAISREVSLYRDRQRDPRWRVQSRDLVRDRTVPASWLEVVA